jgi:hypothetical protein
MSQPARGNPIRASNIPSGSTRTRSEPPVSHTTSADHKSEKRDGAPGVNYARRARPLAYAPHLTSPHLVRGPSPLCLQTRAPAVSSNKSKSALRPLASPSTRCVFKQEQVCSTTSCQPRVLLFSSSAPRGSQLGGGRGSQPGGGRGSQLGGGRGNGCGALRARANVGDRMRVKISLLLFHVSHLILALLRRAPKPQGILISTI